MVEQVLREAQGAALKEIYEEVVLEADPEAQVRRALSTPFLQCVTSPLRTPRMLFFSHFWQLALLQQCLEELRQRQHAAAHRPSRRKAVRGPQAARVDEIRRDPARPGTDQMYLPVDLAYVDNVEEARVLSWAAGDSLDALVVHHEGLWKDLMKGHVKVPF
jgi:hypothetical protein